MLFAESGVPRHTGTPADKANALKDVWASRSAAIQGNLAYASGIKMVAERQDERKTFYTKYLIENYSRWRKQLQGLPREGEFIFLKQLDHQHFLQSKVIEEAGRVPCSGQELMIIFVVQLSVEEAVLSQFYERQSKTFAIDDLLRSGASDEVVGYLAASEVNDAVKLFSSAELLRQALSDAKEQPFMKKLFIKALLNHASSKMPIAQNGSLVGAAWKSATGLGLKMPAWLATAVGEAGDRQGIAIDAEWLSYVANRLIPTDQKHGFVTPEL